jgi:hypothetical protein
MPPACVCPRGMAMAKPLVIMIAGSGLTWAVVMAIHVLAIHGP